MSSPDKKKGNLKQKIFHEMFEYWMNFFYLTLMFAAFAQYRRFVLAAHDIIYTNYGIAVIEAAVLVKVIMIGGVFRLGRGLEKKPLLFSSLYKTVVFSLFVTVFKLIEHMIMGLWKGNGLAQGLAFCALFFTTVLRLQHVASQRFFLIKRYVSSYILSRGPIATSSTIRPLPIR